MSFAGIIRESLSPYKGTTKTVLVEMLLNCNYRDNPDFIFNSKKLPLKRGQWIASQQRLSEGTGLSRQQIRTSLENLKKLTIISTNNLTNHATLYTIVNIDKFLVKENEQPAIQPAIQPTGNQRVTINNKEDKDNKDYSNKDTLDSFEEFWILYGKKRDRGKAEKSYAKVIKKGINHERIMEGLRRYKEECFRKKTPPEYIKHPATWLNQRCWEDEYNILPETTQEYRNQLPSWREQV